MNTPKRPARIAESMKREFRVLLEVSPRLATATMSKIGHDRSVQNDG
jgi:hypothetical protein